MTLFWILPLAKRLLGVKRLKPRRRARLRGRLGLEVLEDRLVPAPFIVTTTDDSGDDNNPLAGSLRQAVKEVNLGNKDGIQFNIPGGGFQTVKVKSKPFPAVTRTVTIDGGAVAGQDITIRPDPAHPLDAGSVGLTFGRAGANSADNSQILGLTIFNFPGDGILLNNVGNVHIGFKDSGSVRTFDSMIITRNGGTPVGVTFSAGIHITGAMAVNNTILGNFIGTNANSDANLGNSDGILIDGNASGNSIGGMGEGERNVISGNGFIGNGTSGIEIEGSNGNTVIGNYIGTKANGKDKLPNQTGVSIRGGVSNTIGGEASTVAGIIQTPANVISGNGAGPGVLISGAGATNNKLYGNFIGTDKTGTIGVGNVGSGVVLAGASQNFIGGPTAGKRNVISANGYGETRFHGIGLAGSSRNRIENNNIGLGPVREGPAGVLLPNAGDAVNYDATSNDNIIKNTKFAQDKSIAVKDGGQRNKVLDPNSILGEGPAIFRGSREGVPVLTSAVVAPNPRTGVDEITISGSLSHAPRSEYILEFFGNTVRNRQAERFLGSVTVMTDFRGVASFAHTCKAIYGTSVTATSTGTASDGFTSEVSDDVSILNLSQTATVSDRVWLDLDGDGLQDPDETQGVDGVHIRLYTAAGVFVAETVTTGGGYYVITGVQPGDYYLQFFAPAGYDFTLAYQGDSILDSDADPVFGDTAVFTLIAGQVDPTFDAGLVRLMEGAARRFRGPRRR